MKVVYNGQVVAGKEADDIEGVGVMAVYSNEGNTSFSVNGSTKRISNGLANVVAGDNSGTKVMGQVVADLLAMSILPHDDREDFQPFLQQIVEHIVINASSFKQSKGVRNEDITNLIKPFVDNIEDKGWVSMMYIKLALGLMNK